MSFLFVDKITDTTPGLRIQGTKTISACEPYLLNIPGEQPIFPLALIGETLGQLAAWNAMEHLKFTLRPVAGVVSQVNFLRPAYVGETINFIAEIESLEHHAIQYNGRAIINNETILNLEGAIGPMLPMTDFIDSDLVSLQYQQVLHDKKNQVSCAAPANIFCVDEILSHEIGFQITAQKYIPPDAPFFQDHFPLKPVYPLTLLLENTMALAKVFLESMAPSKTYSISALRRIKMNTFVNPGDTIDLTLHIKSETSEGYILMLIAKVFEKKVCILELIVKSKPI